MRDTRWSSWTGQRRLNVSLLVAVIWGACIGTAWSGVDLQSDGTPGAQMFNAEGSFQLECWQAGKRILVQGGLQGMTVGPALNGRTISFRGSDKGGASVVLLPFDHSLCVTVAE